jgi:hypothetical protein
VGTCLAALPDGAARLGAAVLACVSLTALAGANAALADPWLPHPAGAKWQYVWTDSVFNPKGTIEDVDVQQQTGPTFTLAWADPQDQLPGPGTSPSCTSSTADVGTMTFQDTDQGLINTDWNSCPPVSMEPTLCAVVSPCPNSLSGALFNVIWGNRSPVLSEPLLRGTTWNASGGAQNDVASTSTYLGQQRVTVPAFPNGVVAAVVRTQILQVGALGDPYGSGTRTTWWVYGVGPVKVVFAHPGGSYAAGPAPVTTVSLQSTNLVAQAPPPDSDFFPLVQGSRSVYKWINQKHLRQPEVEAVTVAKVSNRSAEVTTKSVSGPLHAVGAYVFTLRLDGLTNLSGNSAAASLAKLPPLGHGRHFFTPIDLLTYGFNPVLPAYPERGNHWKSGNPADFSVYGVTGSTRVIGMAAVHVPAGTFRALEVQSVLRQRGYPFGSGTRTSWFAPNRGLVKLVFHHADGSVSIVQLMR